MKFFFSPSFYFVYYIPREEGKHGMYEVVAVISCK